MAGTKANAKREGKASVKRKAERRWERMGRIKYLEQALRGLHQMQEEAREAGSFVAARGCAQEALRVHAELAQLRLAEKAAKDVSVLSQEQVQAEILQLVQADWPEDFVERLEAAVQVRLGPTREQRALATSLGLPDTTPLAQVLASAAVAVERSRRVSPQLTLGAPA